jgi:hypothetical protein
VEVIKTYIVCHFGYYDQDGIMIESWFRRYSARFTLDNEINKWLKIGGSIALVKSTERLVSDAMAD